MLRRHSLFSKAMATTLLLLPCLPCKATLAISGVHHHIGSEYGSNEGLTGICYVSGTQYYAVYDSGGLVQSADIAINLVGGAMSTITFEPAVHLGGSDMEGIDYNPLTTVCSSATKQRQPSRSMVSRAATISPAWSSRRFSPTGSWVSVFTNKPPTNSVSDPGDKFCGILQG